MICNMLLLVPVLLRRLAGGIPGRHQCEEEELLPHRQRRRPARCVFPPGCPTRVVRRPMTSFSHGLSPSLFCLSDSVQLFRGAVGLQPVSHRRPQVRLRVVRRRVRLPLRVPGLLRRGGETHVSRARHPLRKSSSPRPWNTK